MEATLCGNSGHREIYGKSYIFEKSSKIYDNGLTFLRKHQKYKTMGHTFLKKALEIYDRGQARKGAGRMPGH